MVFTWITLYKTVCTILLYNHMYGYVFTWSNSPKICSKCKYFLASDNSNPIYGKCLFFKKLESELKGNFDNKYIEYLVSGIQVETQEPFDWWFCSTARKYEDMCGLEGTKYEPIHPLLDNID